MERVPRPMSVTERMSVPGLVVVLCLLLASCSSSTTGQPAPAPAPPAPSGAGARLLGGWKLTIPEPGKKGSAATVDPAQVTPPWLTTDPADNLVFWAPVNGATTKHSEHPR